MTDGGKGSAVDTEKMRTWDSPPTERERRVRRTRETWRRITRRTRRVLWGESCICCGDRGVGDELLCGECAARFQAKLVEICPECGLERVRCLCAPPHLREAGCDMLLKLAAYDAGDPECPLNMIIARQKRLRDREAARFLAELLSAPVRELMEGMGCLPADVIISYVPRDPAKVREVGHDQARLLAAALAERLCVPMRQTLSRRAGSREQKKLTAAERRCNVQSRFAVVRGVSADDIAGKRVILVDDLVTTGATAGACAAVLSGLGAQVICAAVAYTPPHAEGAGCDAFPI